MNTLEIILLIAVIGVINSICFLLGARTAQKLANKQEVVLPNPAREIRKIANDSEYRREREKVQKLLDNIDRYDGTPFGQQDV